MKDYIVLLRGINVGSKNRIKMKELVASLSKSGLRDIAYYIQSGNLLLSSETPPSDIIEQILRDNWDISTPVLSIPTQVWQSIYQNQPYPKSEIDSLHLTLLHTENTMEASKLSHLVREGESYTIVHNVVYLNIPGKYHQSKLSNNHIEKATEVSATTRSWKTVQKLYDMTLIKNGG